MTTIFYLVRHAEAEVNANPLTVNKEDVLTEKGARQARLVAERFKGTKIDGVYTSKIGRARLTAHEIGGTLGLTPVIVESFKERKVVYTSAKEYSYVETFASLKDRLAESKKFLEERPAGSFIIVSHALYIRALVAHLVFGELLDEKLLEKMTDTFLVGNSSVTTISYQHDKGRWYIEAWNDEAHLSR